MNEPLLLGLFLLALLLFVLLSIAVIMSYLYFSQKSQFHKRLHEEYKKLVENVNQQGQEQLKEMRKQDLAQLQQWREQELEISKKQQYDIANNEITAQFNQWKLEFEKTIRQDAIQRSQAVTVGKVTEHIVPYLPEFPFNPKDARFIGSPIDLIVFDGLNEDKCVEVVFIEIKQVFQVLVPGRGKLGMR